MVYRLPILSNNVTATAGDSLLVSFSVQLSRVASVTSVAFTFEPDPGATSGGHDSDVRWSHDKITWSAWAPLDRYPTMPANPFPSIIATGAEMFLQFRLIRRSSGPQALLTEAVITYSVSPAAEQPVVSPFAEEGCVAQSCPTDNACSGLVMACDPALVYRPYDSMGPAIKLYIELACAASEMFGHCVRYFRVQADENSADAVLHEHSIFDAVDVKDIKVLVPDNVFPDNQFHFTQLDMEFDQLEVHIVKDHFERAFGHLRGPQEKDFLYFPLVDRLYEVSSSYLFRSFMQAPVYHKVMLRKWQDKKNVLKDRANPAIEQYVDDLTDDFQELLQGDINDQFAIVTKPQVYRTISVGGFDHVRQLLHEDLRIEESNLDNYFTPVAKYYYDMSSVAVGDLAVQWKRGVTAGPTHGLALSAWINPRQGVYAPESLFQFVMTGAGLTAVNTSYAWTYPTMGASAYFTNDEGYYVTYTSGQGWYVRSPDGTPQYRSSDVGTDWLYHENLYYANYPINWSNFGGSGPAPYPSSTSTPEVPRTDRILSGVTGTAGPYLSLVYGSSGGTAVPTYFQFGNGDAVYNFTGLPGITGWRGVVLNIMPEFAQVQLNMWEMQPTSAKTTQLRLVYSSVLPYVGATLSNGEALRSFGGGYWMTNFRLWEAPIEEEKQGTILNQYVPRDTHLALIVDNAVPPLRMARTYTR